jgi:hypothetical protein
MEDVQTFRPAQSPRRVLRVLFLTVLICCWILAGGAFAWAGLYKDPDGLYCISTAGTDLVANWSANGAPCHIRGTFYFLTIAFGLAFGTGLALSVAFIFLHAEQFLRRLRQG